MIEPRNVIRDVHCTCNSSKYLQDCYIPIGYKIVPVPRICMYTRSSAQSVGEI